MGRNRSSAVLAALVLVIAASAGSASAAAFKVLHRFRGHADGETPLAGLVADNHGNLYGTTAGGGGTPGKNCSKNCGGGYVLFTTGAIKTFFTFNGKNGSNPTAPLLFHKGYFYGTTDYGGANDEGVVFRLSKDGKIRVLYSFCSQPNCTDGAIPASSVIVDSAGNFYGTTLTGGANNYGTVFRLAPDGTETVLYSFCSQPNCNDGDGPTAGLVADAVGNLYGTTQFGGAGSAGTVFRLAPDGTETILHTFCTTSLCPDGNSPQAPLIMDGAGNLYGTTNGGGANIFWGTVFKVTPKGRESVLYSFCPGGQNNCVDGSNPEAPLTLDSAGNLYGTTWGGGDTSCGCGTIFKLRPGGKETVLHAFDFTDGQLPQTAFLLLQGDELYGTAPQGGKQCDNLGFGCGTVFKVRKK